MLKIKKNNSGAKRLKRSQRRLTADWLAHRESDCSWIHSKVSSEWVSSYFKVKRPVLEIFKMDGYFPESPRILFVRVLVSSFVLDKCLRNIWINDFSSLSSIGLQICLFLWKIIHTEGVWKHRSWYLVTNAASSWCQNSVYRVLFDGIIWHAQQTKWRWREREWLPVSAAGDVAESSKVKERVPWSTSLHISLEFLCFTLRRTTIYTRYSCIKNSYFDGCVFRRVLIPADRLLVLRPSVTPRTAGRIFMKLLSRHLIFRLKLN